jgi:serine/threonine-protein kinase
MLLPATIGRYTVIREVARGGMGAIVAGRDDAMGREVAIKVMLEAHANKPGFRERFLEEARITSSLQHPGVVPVYELGELPDSRPFFAMRMVEGETLDALLAAQPDPAAELPRYLQVFDRVCQAVAFAHAHGVIHRDLKPLNVMVGRFGVVNVMDWGVACRKGASECPVAACQPTGPHPCLPEDVIGTPAYMSPEQARGDNCRVDERADVFGLGGILCAILTGRPPYTGSQTRKVHSRAARADLAEAFARLDAAPAARELVRLAKWCLSAHRDSRPRDAGEVSEALSAYLDSDLRQSARDMLRFFDLSPDLFCIAGLDGYFRRVNGNFTRVLGYTPGELIARPYIDFVHPADREATAREAEKLSRGLPVVHFRNRYRDVRGAYRWFEWEAKSISEEGIIFAVARDITARMELEGN